MAPQAPPPTPGRTGAVGRPGPGGGARRPAEGEALTAPIVAPGGRASRRTRRGADAEDQRVDLGTRRQPAIDLDDDLDDDRRDRDFTKRDGRAGEAWSPRTSRLAIGALVAAILVPIVGLGLGILAFTRIRRSGEGGRGLALAAIVVGAVLTVAAVVATVLLMTSSGTAAPAAGGAAGAAAPADGPSLPARLVEQKILETGAVSASCPKPLPAVVGASVECTAGLAGGPAPVTATVTGINGGDVSFDLNSK